MCFNENFELEHVYENFELEVSVRIGSLKIVLTYNLCVFDVVCPFSFYGQENHGKVQYKGGHHGWWR